VTTFDEQPLRVSASGRHVPTVLWVPAAESAPVPLVLVGHGGGGHKRDATVSKMAAGFAAEHGIATLAIDGPVNGDRDTNTAEALALRKRDRHAYRRQFYLEKYDEMIEDFRAALEAAIALPQIDGERIGYWGLSMGTRFGVPLIVAEPRIKAAVIGLFGHSDGNEASQRVYDDAARIAIPILFLQQLGDGEVSQAAYRTLFDRVGTSDKRLHANPGGHAQVPKSELEASRLFLARKLRGWQGW